ncbi:formate hydrogenlyase maturation HycH family protein [Acerihabitans sp. TG2]|uniref:formate hydrogenlyase maturation HycH family protein n=1 Tax=Acerihabitans sp. TG2 TaxID=3096008 RepID=UPI002B231652|nr:formate hydrogenlyase maturation HycH family protein [Acerihabitans sp. TG2]MEA9391363.1 formate hydrogenlyase maturation HycH family protein [Acerihabitans sp. TG2]
MADVVFWSLRQKFLDSDEDMPAQAKQVMYYSLAIGHHVGVIDCLNKEFSCPLDQYQQWVDLLAPGEARRKMQGLLTFGEIVIDSTHTNLLATALAPLRDDQVEPFAAWSANLIALLTEITHEPAIYLIVRRVL